MKEHERKELEKLEALRKTIEASPLTQQILAEEAATILAKRTEAAGKIEVLKTERDAVIPKLLAVLEAKEAKYKKAKAAMDAVGGEYNAAKYELSSGRNNFSTAISTQAQILIESADPLIDETIQFFRAKFDDLQRPGRVSSRGLETVRNIFTETVTRTTETNRGAVLGAMQYCRDAIKGLEALKLSPEFHIELMQELKDALPSIEVYQEVTGEKPMEGSKGIPFASQFKSDDQLDWEMGKLNEKFKKLMRK